MAPDMAPDSFVRWSRSYWFALDQKAVSAIYERTEFVRIWPSQGKSEQSMSGHWPGAGGENQGRRPAVPGMTVETRMGAR